MRSILFFTLLPLLASATTPLLARSSCPSDSIACGDTCIPTGYTCCPDKLGGCSSKDTCAKGDNGVYGCCPIGAFCTGNGSTNEVDSKALASSSASIASATSTASASSTTKTNSASGLQAKDGMMSGVMVLAMVGGLAQIL